MAKLIGPDNCSDEVSVGGSTFTAVDGVFEVPDELAGELLHHGFSIAPEPKKRRRDPSDSAE